eukprot:SM000044S15923  [mRNA]  locus=s44:45125:50474:- [translate_table: standard]
MRHNSAAAGQMVRHPGHELLGGVAAARLPVARRSVRRVPLRHVAGPSHLLQVRAANTVDAHGKPGHEAQDSPPPTPAAPDVSQGEAVSFWRINDEDQSFHSRAFRVRYARQDVHLQELVSFHLSLADIPVCPLPTAALPLTSRTPLLLVSALRFSGTCNTSAASAYRLTCCIARNARQKPASDAAIIRFELLFAPVDRMLPKDRAPEELSSVASHSFRIIREAWQGLHSHCPVHFDAWHMVQLDCYVHTTVRSSSQGSKPARAVACADDTEAESVVTEAGEEVPPGEASSADKWLLRTLYAASEALREELEDLLGQVESTSEDLSVKPPGTSPMAKKLARLHSEAAASAELQATKGDEDVATEDLEERRISGHLATVSGKAKVAAEPPSLARLKEVDEGVQIMVDDFLQEEKLLANEVSALWNVFLNFHRLYHMELCQYLKERWEDAAADEWSMWVVGTELDLQTDDLYGVEGGDWVARWRTPKLTLSKRQQEERAVNSAARAELYRRGLTQAKCKHCPLQDLQIFETPAAQPILFSELHVAGFKGRLRHLDTTAAYSPRGSEGNLQAAVYCASASPSPRASPRGQAPTSLHSPADVAAPAGISLGYPKVVGLAVNSAPVLEYPEPGRTLPRGGRRPRGDGSQVDDAKDYVLRRRNASTKNVVVFVHGFQGHHLDLRMIRNRWLVMDPDVECIMSEANEDRTFDSFQEMGQRLAEEVAGVLAHMFSATTQQPHSKYTLGRLSFVGHSIGCVIIRAALTRMTSTSTTHAICTVHPTLGPHCHPKRIRLWTCASLDSSSCVGTRSPGQKSYGHINTLVYLICPSTDEAMRPYLENLHAFLSISGPHLGYLYSSNSLFNGGLWVLKRFKQATVMHELTFTDRADINDCYLFRLSQSKTFECFKHVLLISSPQDRYVPYHSARIEMCPAAMRDSKRGAFYATMVQGCLGPLLKAVANTEMMFVRCDVNFVASPQAGSLNNMIGRTAHIEFLETDTYMHFFLGAHRDCFR